MTDTMTDRIGFTFILFLSVHLHGHNIKLRRSLWWTWWGDIMCEQTFTLSEGETFPWLLPAFNMNSTLNSPTTHQKATSFSLTTNLPLKAMFTWGARWTKTHGIGTIPQTAIMNPGFNVLNCDLIITPLSKDAQIPANDSRTLLERIIHPCALDSTMFSLTYSERKWKR